MEEKKNNKGLVWLIVILIILVLGLVGYIVFDKVLKDDKTISNNDETTTTITTTTQSNVNIPIKYEMKKKEAIKFEFKNDIIEYPVINSEDESIVNLNKTILQNVDKVIKELKDEGRIVTDSEYNGLCHLKIQDDGQKREYCNYTLLTYEVTDSAKYLTIIEKSWYVSLNGTGSVAPQNVYVIDKSNNKVINNKELINSISNLSDLKNDLINYINKNYDSFMYFSNIEKSKFTNEITNLLNNNELIVYFDEKEIVFYFEKIQNKTHILFSHSEEEGWEDSTWLYMP